MDYLTLKINKIKLYNSISTNQINRNRELLIYNYRKEIIYENLFLYADDEYVCEFFMFFIR